MEGKLERKIALNEFYLRYIPAIVVLYIIFEIFNLPSIFNVLFLFMYALNMFLNTPYINEKVKAKSYRLSILKFFVAINESFVKLGKPGKYLLPLILMTGFFLINFEFSIFFSVLGFLLFDQIKKINGTLDYL